MRDRFRQKMMSLLLSVLVLALEVVPPGVEHAHAGGGDSSHRHGKCQEAAHHDLHSFHSHAPHSGEKHHEYETVSDESLLADLVSHLHWQFFGVDFSMPISENPTGGTDDEEDVSSAYLCVVREIMPVIQIDTSFDRMLLAACMLNVVEVVWSQDPIPRRLDLVTAIPLCDSARFKRSGVLLS